MLLADPVDGPLDLAAVGRVAALALRVPGGLQPSDGASGVLEDLCALDQAGVPQTDLTVRLEAEELGVGVLAEVLAFNIDLRGQSHRTAINFKLDIAVQVGDGDRKRVEDAHSAGKGGLQLLLKDAGQHVEFDSALPLGHTDLGAELLNGRCGVPTAPHATEGGHTGIIPATNDLLLDKLQQLALAHDGVGQVEAGKLDLAWCVRDGQVGEEPLVQGAVQLELQRADGVSDALQGIALAVGIVVHGVDAPLVSCAVVVGVLDAVDGGITHVHVWVGHVNLSTEHALPILELAILHAVKQGQVLFNSSVAKRTVRARLNDTPSVLAHLCQCLAVHIGNPILDHVQGPLIVLVKVVRGKVQVVTPYTTQPGNVLLDGLHILSLLFGRVCIVEAQVGAATKLPRQTKI
mmetsp:Transcript_82104/g.145037  ORF Transcript_82104/g.145037 Transcript_82104/m.145037 type:complete len:405 (+) Transcript_82104:1424-2638(+)